MVVEKFLVPKAPRLFPGMLWPRVRRNSPLSPISGRVTYHLFWARNAIYHGLRALRIAPGDNVLVPSFHCTSVVEPILRYGARVKFYDIGRQLRADLEDIEQKVDPRTRAILTIHYFGFPQPMGELRAFCNNHGIHLIEDCAHVLAGRTEDGASIGSIGDISIFSWRKFLPLYDGGQLVINDPQFDVTIPWDRGEILFSLKVAKNIFDRLIDDSSSPAVQRLGQISRVPSVWARRLASMNGHSPKAFRIHSYDLDFDLASANLRMSSLSKFIVSNIDLMKVVVKRRENYSRLLAVVKSLPGVTPFYPDLPECVCPWVFPLLVHKVTDFHLILRKKGIPAFTWGGVIHRDLPLEQFPTSRFLYDRLVFLPIHQSIGVRELETMVEILRQELDRNL